MPMFFELFLVCNLPVDLWGWALIILTNQRAQAVKWFQVQHPIHSGFYPQLHVHDHDKHRVIHVQQ